MSQTSTPIPGNEATRWARESKENTGEYSSNTSISSYYSDGDFFDRSIPSYNSTIESLLPWDETVAPFAFNPEIEEMMDDKLLDFIPVITRKGKRALLRKLPRNKKKKQRQIKTRANILSNFSHILPDKRPADDEALGTPVAKRLGANFRIDANTPTEQHDANATILKDRGGYNEIDDMDEDAETVAVLTEDEDNIEGIPEQAAIKIKKTKQTLLDYAYRLKEREERLKQAEEWARTQEEERMARAEAELEAKKAKEAERAKQALAAKNSSRKSLEAEAADPGNTSLGEELIRMLWFYSSHDKKLRYSELSFNQFRRTYMSILRGMTKEKEDGEEGVQLPLVQVRLQARLRGAHST